MTPERENSQLPVAQANPNTAQPHISNEPYDTDIHKAIFDGDLSTRIDTGQLEAVQGGIYESPRQAAVEASFAAEADEVKESHTVRNAALAGAALVLAGGVIYGANSLANQPAHTAPNTQPSATGTSVAGEAQTPAPGKTAETPSANPTNPANLTPLETATATPAAAETKKPVSDVMPASLEKYKEMTVEQFATLPKSEQLTYWSWQSRNLNAFTDKVYQTTLDPRDKLVAPSLDNTAQELAAIQGANFRYIFTIENDTEREKALISVLHDGRQSDAYPLWMAQLKQIPSDILNIKLLVKNVAATTDIVADGPVQTTGGETFRDIKYATGSAPIRGFFTEYKDAQTGAQSATWIQR